MIIDSGKHLEAIVKETISQQVFELLRLAAENRALREELTRIEQEKQATKVEKDA